MSCLGFKFQDKGDTLQGIHECLNFYHKDHDLSRKFETMINTSRAELLQVAPPKDPVIIVMGMTGAGKSTFISDVAGQETGIGHELSSYTQGVEFYSLELNDRVVHFVDTPGFDDTWRSDLEILKQIAYIMSRIYQQGMRLAGILYLHRISDNRVTGAAMKNFSLLRKLCGIEAAPWVTLVTSMWDLLDTGTKDFQEAVLRESTLISTNDFWGGLWQQGCQVKRWHLDDSSALSIVNDTIAWCDRNGPAIFQIQKELIDEGRPLHQTSAGRELSGGYDAAEKRLLGEIQSFQESPRDSNPELTSPTSDLRKEIEELRHAQAEMKMSVRRLFAEKEKSYAKALSKMQDEQQKLAQELEQGRREYERLEADMEVNEETLQNEREQWRLKREELNRDERLGRRNKKSIEIERQQIKDEEGVFEEECLENEDERTETLENIDRLRKRDVMKRNLIPFLGVLAGVGVTIAGAVTGVTPLIGAGLGIAIDNAKSINLSRRRKIEDEDYACRHRSRISQ